MTDFPSNLVVVLPAAIGVASLALLVFAFRGRRVDDHPICRKCGFDLFGRPEGARVCSECGADLARPRAVRVGHREKRRRVLAFTLPVLLVSVAWLGLLGWGGSRGTDWNKHKPVGWLMRDARGPGAATRDVALGELIQRVRDGKLSQRHVDALVDLALEVQADPSRPWVDGWGEAIGAARDAGKLAPEKWRRYARQGVEVRLQTRPILRRGDWLVFAYVPAGPRLAGRHAFDVKYTPGPVRAGDRPLGRHLERPVANSIKGRQATQRFVLNTMRLNPGVWAGLRDGPQTFRSTVRLQVADAAGGTTGDLVDQTVELTAPVTVVPFEADAVKLRTDPELKAAVEKAVRVEQLVLNHPGSVPGIVGQVRAAQPPVPVVSRVFIRAGGREWDVGTVQFPAGATSGNVIHRLGGELPGFDPKAGPVEVVLKPNVDEAVGTLDLTEIWGGEVVFKDVPVSEVMRRAARPPATRPARPSPR